MIELLISISIMAIVSTIITINATGDIPLAKVDKSLKEIDIFSRAITKELSHEASRSLAVEAAAPPANNYGGYFEHAVTPGANLLDKNLNVPSLGGLIPNRLYKILPNLEAGLPLATSSVEIIGVSNQAGFNYNDYRSGLDLANITVKVSRTVRIGRIVDNIDSFKRLVSVRLKKYNATSPDLAAWTGRNSNTLTFVVERNLLDLRDTSYFKTHISLRVKTPLATSSDLFNIKLPLFEQYEFVGTSSLTSSQKTVYVVWAPAVGDVSNPAPVIDKYSTSSFLTPGSFSRLCVVSNMFYDENSPDCFSSGVATSETVAAKVYSEFLKLGLVSPALGPYRNDLVEPQFKVKKYHRFY